MEQVKRKRRVDRKQIIYQLTTSVNGNTYVGLTVMVGQGVWKAVKLRFLRHASKARTTEIGRSLLNEIRNFGEEAFLIEVLEVVRGKVNAHVREREIIAELGPVLNDQ